jgi:hypothetical protein
MTIPEKPVEAWYGYCWPALGEACGNCHRCQVVPDAAVEAAVDAHCDGTMRDALEAAAPYMISHEREKTRLAHVDAVVNAQTVDRLEKELAEANLSPTVNASAVIAELRLFNHHEAAALIESLVNP